MAEYPSVGYRPLDVLEVFVRANKVQIVNLAPLESNVLDGVPGQLAQARPRDPAVADIEIFQRATTLLVGDCHQKLVRYARPREVQLGQFKSFDGIRRSIGHVRTALQIHQVQPGTVSCQQCHQLVVHQGAIPDGQLLQVLELPDDGLQATTAEAVISLGQYKAFKVWTFFGQRKQRPVGDGRTGKVYSGERSVQEHFQQFVIMESSLDAGHVQNQRIFD